MVDKLKEIVKKYTILENRPVTVSSQDWMEFIMAVGFVASEAESRQKYITELTECRDFAVRQKSKYLSMAKSLVNDVKMFCKDCAGDCRMEKHDCQLFEAKELLI